MPQPVPLTPEEERRLIAAADAARAFALAPYSHFHVGAALLAEDGRIFSGCNVESASYGLTVCGERTAVFKAISEGARAFRAVAVVVDTERPTVPCGACRQVLWDQCREIQVVMATPRGAVDRAPLSALLPRPFEFGGRE